MLETLFFGLESLFFGWTIFWRGSWLAGWFRLSVHGRSISEKKNNIGLESTDSGLESTDSDLQSTDADLESTD